MAAAAAPASSSRGARAVGAARGTKRSADDAALDLDVGASAAGAIDVDAGEVAQALRVVTGLARLTDTMYASVGRPALVWCTANDVDDVRQIVAAEQVDAFVGACGVKRGGTKERILRMRLAALAPEVTN